MGHIIRTNQIKERIRRTKMVKELKTNSSWKEFPSKYEKSKKNYRKPNIVHKEVKKSVQ